MLCSFVTLKFNTSDSPVIDKDVLYFKCLPRVVGKGSVHHNHRTLQLNNKRFQFVLYNTPPSGNTLTGRLLEEALQTGACIRVPKYLKRCASLCMWTESIVCFNISHRLACKTLSLLEFILFRRTLNLLQRKPKQCPKFKETINQYSCCLCEQRLSNKHFTRQHSWTEKYAVWFAKSLQVLSK